MASGSGYQRQQQQSYAPAPDQHQQANQSSPLVLHRQQALTEKSPSPPNLTKFIQLHLQLYPQLFTTSHPDFPAYRTIQQEALQQTRLVLVSGATQLNKLGNPYEARRLLHFFQIDPDLDSSRSDSSDELVRFHFEINGKTYDRESFTGQDYISLPSGITQSVAIRLLLKLLPNIRELTVVVIDRFPPECQIQLLANWKSLYKLKIVHPGNEHFFLWKMLEKTLLALTQLRHISLNYQLNNLLFPSIKDLSHLTPVLVKAPLEEINITCHDYSALLFFVHMMRMNNPNWLSRITQLGLCDFTFNTQSVLTDSMLAPIWKKITRLHAKIPTFQLERGTLSKWRALVYLDLNKFDSKPPKVVKKTNRPQPKEPNLIYSSRDFSRLSVLPALTELHLTNDFTSENFDRIFPLFSSVSALHISDACVDPHVMLKRLSPALPRVVRTEFRYPAPLLEQQLNDRKNTFFCAACLKLTSKTMKQHNDRVESIVWSVNNKSDKKIKDDEQGEYEEAKERSFQLNFKVVLK